LLPFPRSVVPAILVGFGHLKRTTTNPTSDWMRLNLDHRSRKQKRRILFGDVLRERVAQKDNASFTRTVDVCINAPRLICSPTVPFLIDLSTYFHTYIPATHVSYLRHSVPCPFIVMVCFAQYFHKSIKLQLQSTAGLSMCTFSWVVPG